MAEQSVRPAEWADTIQKLAKTQRTFQETISFGRVPLEKEVQVRAQLADLLGSAAPALQHLPFVHDAIQHLETILRRIGPVAAEESRYKSMLSSVKLTEYMMTDSRHALDLAVQYGHDAVGAASESRSRESDQKGHLSSLINLGSALSRRHARFGDLDDLDSAIACFMEVYHAASEGSEQRILSANNLVSQLRRKFDATGDIQCLDEAEILMDDLLRTTAKGSRGHNMALAQSGFISSARYQQTQSLRSNTYSRTGLCTDMSQLLTNWERLLDSMPTALRNRTHFVLDYLNAVKEAVHDGAIAGEVLRGHIARGSKEISTIALNHSERKRCQLIVCNLLGNRYVASGDLRDLSDLVDYGGEMIGEHNRRVEKPGSREQPVNQRWIETLKAHLLRVLDMPPHDPKRALLEQEWLAFYLSCNTDSKAALVVLEEVFQMHRLRFRVIEEATTSHAGLDDDAIELRIREHQNEESTRTAEPTLDLRLPHQPDEYETELGLRSLAVGAGGDIICDFSNMLSDVMGYDNTTGLSPAQFIARERRLERRAVEEIRAQGRHPNLDLCRMCRDFAKVIEATSSGFRLTSRHSYLPFGNVYQLFCRQQCSFCTLLLSSITTRSGSLHPQLQAIDREVQGIRLSTGTLQSSERVMCVDYGLKYVTEIRVLTPQTYRHALRQAWEDDDPSLLSTLFTSRKRAICDPEGQQVDIGMIRSWLLDCDHNHSSTCNGPKAGVRADGEMPLTFIDVFNECLVCSTSREKYFALSYVWGQTIISKTVMRNFQRRQQSGSLSALTLPRTIRDAMQLVRSLQERYLWVDAICMVQDDAVEMARDIPKMDIVYDRAFATIVALDGEHADAGLPGIAKGSRRPQKMTAVRISGRSPRLDYIPHSADAEDIGLVASPCPLHMALEASKWNTRGWTAQERLLSRRCLYFSSDYVYFQCDRHTLNECGINERYSALQWDTTPILETQFREAADLKNPLNYMESLYDLSPLTKLKKAFDIYKRLVKFYTPRAFTNKSDILNGFAGMFSVLRRHLQSENYMGLPAAIFGHALLWSPVERLPRRGCRLPTHADIRMGKPDVHFPSWSWVGWDGAVEYRLFSSVDGEIQLPTSMISCYEFGSGSGAQLINIDHHAYGLTRNETAKRGAADISGIHDAEAIAAYDSRENSEQHDDDGKQAPLQGTIVRNKRKAPDDGTGAHLAAVQVSDASRHSSWTILPPQKQEPWDDPLPGNILTFVAVTVPIAAFGLSPEKGYLIKQHHTHSQSNQAVRRIYDREGKHCGLWWEQAGYGYVGLGLNKTAERNIHLVAISAYGCSYYRWEGQYRVEGEIKIFDERAFPAVGGNSLIHILVVDSDLNNVNAIGFRCTVAIMHAQAWSEAGPRKRTVRLA